MSIWLTALVENASATNQPLDQTRGSKQLYVVHFSSFAFLVAILSFVLIFEFKAGIARGIIFTFAVSLHLFISNDSIIEHYKELQIRIGRFIATIIPIIGWSISVAFPERIAEAYVLLALISGVILYHSIKNEVPSAVKKQSLTMFLIGVVFYTLLLFIHSIIVA